MRTYAVRVSVLLEPVGTPDVAITCGGEIVEVILSEPTWFDFSYTQDAGPSQLTVEHRNRQDYVTAVIVKTVKLNDIENSQNIYQGMYYPNNMDAKSTNYVDWNGTWVLDFTVPVYTWLHKTQNLGWIYD